jgi:hypothetical protein
VLEVFGSTVAKITAIMAEVFCSFPQLFQANAGVVPWLGHSLIFLNPLKLIIYLPSDHPTL